MEGIYKAHSGCSKQTSENTLYVRKHYILSEVHMAQARTLRKSELKQLIKYSPLKTES